MYNREIKERYIDHVIETSESSDMETYRIGIYNRFNRTGELESKYEKDILDMSQNELLSFLESFLSGGREYQLNNLSLIKIYCVWGINNGLSSIDAGWLSALRLKDINITQSYANTMLSSESELVDVLDSILDTVNRNTQDNILRCVCMLLFSGVQYNDIWNLKIDEVDIDGRIIMYRNRKIHMSNALYKIIKHNREMLEILIVGRGRTTEHTRSIVNEGYLISNTKSYGQDRDKMKRTYTAAMSMRLSESEKKDLTNTTIYDSGVFCRMLEGEKKNGTIDCMEYLWGRRNQTTTIEYPDRVKAKCAYEYEFWKKSFSL